MAENDNDAGEDKKQGQKEKKLSLLCGKDPDEALKRFLQTPKRKDEEDDEDEESASEGDSEDEGSD